jgi:hypothetical protein
MHKLFLKGKNIYYSYHFQIKLFAFYVLYFSYLYLKNYLNCYISYHYEFFTSYDGE